MENMVTWYTSSICRRNFILVTGFNEVLLSSCYYLFSSDLSDYISTEKNHFIVHVLYFETNYVLSDSPFQVVLYGADGKQTSSFYPFSGVTEELKTFLHDISEASLKVEQITDSCIYRSQHVPIVH